MTVNFPTSLDTLTNPAGGDRMDTVDHASQHADANDAIEALQAKVGADSSAVTTSHDYKLGNVTGSDKAASVAGTETLQNKTLGSGSKITIGSDATGDTYYRGAGGAITRLGIGSNGLYMKSDGSNPTWGSLTASDVDTAGAVMNSDTSTASMSFVIDDDTMATASATTVPTSESVAAFVAAEIAAIPTSAETGLDAEPDGTWFTFVQRIPEVSSGTGSGGWTVVNAGTLTLNGAYVSVADNGATGAQIYTAIPTATEYKIKFFVQTNNTSGIFGIGIGESAITPGTNDDGVYFEFDTTSSYEATTASGASRTQTAISAVTYTNWTEYVIHYRPGTDARFYVDGTLVATNTTTLPTLTTPGVAFYNESASSQIRFTPVIVSLKY